MNGERAFREGVRLVFVVDQDLFEHTTTWGGVNRFCVLHPLMTIDGERLKANHDDFPNRGRVWWMLQRNTQVEWVVPGAIWSGTIEEARLKDKDLFQAKYTDIHPGGPDLIEVLDFSKVEPTLDLPLLDYLYRERGLPWPRPTTTEQVILRGQSHALGPLKATWEGGRLRVSATKLGEPEVLRVPVAAFAKTARVERFTVDLGEHDRSGWGARSRVEIALTKGAWLDLKKLREVGELLDASTDSQVVRWAIKDLGRAQRSELGAAWEKLKAIDLATASGDDADRKRVRFEQIVQDQRRVLELGEQVARHLAESGPFRPLFDAKVHDLAAERVEAEVRRREGEIDARLAEARKRYEGLLIQNEGLEEEYRREKARLEEKIQAEQDERLRAVEERERDLMAREEQVEQHEYDSLRKIEEATRLYEDKASGVHEELLRLYPFLARIGVGAALSPTVAAPGTDAGPIAPRPRFAARPPAPLHLPPMPNGPPVDEKDFLDQFARVVEHRGYAFGREDLINIHACVKSGGLTILAGLSGTGKSSLPRLYAEALGAAFLQIPVRPDWLDDRDLVGAFNAIARRFEPATAGLVEHLKAAADDLAKGGGRIFLACLDEMNLARVEHYFAQFLSVLEQPADRRRITLFAEGLLEPDDPYLAYQQIGVGDNVRFLGTVNIDETTHFFSPKVLDRSQVIAFGAPDLTARRPPAQSGPVPGLRPVALATFLGWARPGVSLPIAREFLLKINDLLRKAGLGLGYRQFDRMLAYVAAAHPFLSEDTALDYQLVQVVLPRLRPGSPSYRETLEKFRAEVPRERFPRAADFLGRMVEAPSENDFFQLL
ncbi:MAG TPA: AAA family ATPase [Isosphaeraceae bacterium]|jgi:hypothetical protein|nr:AAA family ATPase [Isosphaeraceae bacterium]